MVERFRVGQIAGTHGLKGEVKVFPTTDEPERFRKLKTVYLTGNRDELQLTISHVAFSGKFVIVRFKEFSSIEEVERLRGRDVEIDRKDAIPLEEGEYYIPDLIGLTCYEEDGRVLGTLTDVLRTGANDVYEVTAEDGKEYLLPKIPQCIKEVNVEAGYLKVYLMPGLEDL